MRGVNLVFITVNITIRLRIFFICVVGVLLHNTYLTRKGTRLQIKRTFPYILGVITLTTRDHTIRITNTNSLMVVPLFIHNAVYVLPFLK